MENLTAIRKESHATQQEVADYLGISRQAYGNYESGKREPDYETLLKLGEYFNCSIDYLLGSSRSVRYPLLSEFERSLLEQYRNEHPPFKVRFANFLISRMRADRTHEVPLSIQGNLRVLHSVAYISSVARGAVIFSKVNSPFYFTILR